MVTSAKYENVALAVRTVAKAEAVLLIVLNGNDGSGFAVQAEWGLNELLPAILRMGGTGNIRSRSESPTPREIFGEREVLEWKLLNCE